MNLTLTARPSPIGTLALAFDAAGLLRGVSFGDGLERTMRREYPDATFVSDEAPAEASALIDAYFAGDVSALERVAWSLDGAAGGGGFNGRVWRLLAEIRPGATLSYGETAKRAGEPGAAQAAGVALNRNPIPLVLPCHRVVGADGAMVGFGGGLDRKTWLLHHEGILLL